MVTVFGRCFSCAPAVILGVVFFFFGGCGRPDSPETLTLSSAVSLRPAVEALTRDFQKTHPEYEFLLNFGSSGSLRHQISNGAPVDLFISAHFDEIRYLEDRERIAPKGVIPIARNRLVLVFSPELLDEPGFAESLENAKDNPATLPILLDHPAIILMAMGEPDTVPVGRYAREALRTAGRWDALQDRLVFARNAFQILTYLNRGLANAAWIYQSDIRQLPESFLEPLIRIPETHHTPIFYYIARIGRPELQPAIVDFFNFLKSDQAGAILTENGLTPVLP